LKICFLLPAYLPAPIGGYRVVYEYADYLAGKGHEVTLVYPRQASVERDRSPVDRAKDMVWPSLIALRNRPLVNWHKLHPLIRTELTSALTDRDVPDGDIVVATSWRTAGPAAALSPRKGQKFYLIQHHETWDGPEEEVDATWRLPLRKIVISKWLLELGEKLGASDMRHIPNGIDLQRFRVINPPERRPLGILSLYHDQIFKGIPDAMAVLSAYHERFPDVPITMFGAKERGPDLPDWIEFHHNPDQDALVRDIYNANSVYYSASLAEGWALPPAEAMACGLAFVGTDIGGFRDYATHGETALLAPPGDRAGMLANLIAISEDDALRRLIQQNGTRNIARFTWDAAGAAMEEYFQTASGLR
jgi:glycosyltransferase involved in cell wall biosynthesis